MLAIQLPAEIERRLESLVKRTGQTKAHFARQAILEQIEELEDAHLAMARLKQGGKRWTQEELEKGLDLDG